MEPIRIEEEESNVGMDSQSSQTNLKRMRKETSYVWDEFEKIPRVGDEKLKAKCKRCGKIYIGESSHGTSNMKRHILNCPKRDTKDICHLFMSQSDSGLSIRSSQLSQDLYREALATVIIKHGYPFQFVEHEGVRDLLTLLNHDAKGISRNIVEADLLKIYKREKQKLQEIFQLIPGRICLTLDLWSSITTDGYICVTTHFIDKEWRLHKKIINFRYMPTPHTDAALVSTMSSMLEEWGIEKNLFSITLDNASANTTFVNSYQQRLNLKGALLLEGRFFHIRCCAHILNLIMQEGLKEVDESVKKVRESVKFVKGSQARKEKFKACLNELSLDGKKGLRQDVPTRWNSTYLMLESASFYQNAFRHLAFSDANYQDCPSEEEWKRIERITKFLKPFYDLTKSFLGSKYTTANLYFQGVWRIQLKLKEELEGNDTFMINMAQRMQGNFDKYWADYSVILAIAVVLDPRYKLKMIDYSYSKLYGISEGKTRVIVVREALYSLFNEYMSRSSSSSSRAPLPSSVLSHGLVNDDIDSGEEMQDYDTFESQNCASVTKRSQLEMYLEEQTYDRKLPLDILLYWKSVEYRFPELSAMAHDVLMIPISTVASEAAFSVGGRTLDQYRSSLTPENVEALICTRDWISGSSANISGDDYNVDNAMEDLLKVNLVVVEPTASSASNTVNIS